MDMINIPVLYYFDGFPLIEVNIGGPKFAINIMQRVRIKDYILRNNFATVTWTIRDGEKPEDVANKYYGNPYYHWLVLLSAEIIDVYNDWPKESRSLEQVIDQKYKTPTRPGLEVAKRTVHHYEDSYGAWVSYEQFQSIPFSERKEITIYDYLVNENEKKKSITLINKKFAAEIKRQLESTLNENVLT